MSSVAMVEGSEVRQGKSVVRRPDRSFSAMALDLNVQGTEKRKKEKKGALVVDSPHVCSRAIFK